MNLPTERLVLSFGAAIAVATYAYWTYRSFQLGLGITATASIRAGVVLGAFVLLGLVLRFAERTNRPPEP